MGLFRPDFFFRPFAQGFPGVIVTIGFVRAGLSPGHCLIPSMRPRLSSASISIVESWASISPRLFILVFDIPHICGPALQTSGLWSVFHDAILSCPQHPPLSIYILSQVIANILAHPQSPAKD
jgi:hypothetical protein